MNYPNILGKVSEELNLPIEVVDKTYKAYWSCIRNHIQALPLMEDINEEQFSKLHTNFNIPSLGKLYCTYEQVLNAKNRYQLLQNLREKSNDED